MLYGGNQGLDILRVVIRFIKKSLICGFSLQEVRVKMKLWKPSPYVEWQDGNRTQGKLTVRVTRFPDQARSFQNKQENQGGVTESVQKTSKRPKW
jgi:hypothetical protein